MKKLLFFLMPVVFAFSSCARIVISAYGLNRTYTIVSQDNIESLAKQHNIPLSDWFELDILYDYFIRSQDIEIHFRSMNNHLQMLQALYFDKNGDLVSFHITCYADGFPNLRWNRGGVLNTFVPETRASTDTFLTFAKLLPFLNKTSHTKEIVQSDYDYIVVIFWADVMGRQNRRFIRLIQQNVALAQENQRVRIIYVNQDNFMLQLARSRQMQK